MSRGSGGASGASAAGPESLAGQVEDPRLFFLAARASDSRRARRALWKLWAPPTFARTVGGLRYTGPTSSSAIRPLAEGRRNRLTISRVLYRYTACAPS
ncbi:hypothetical protein MTO96_006587 [Rhipicephalus appendiculatus]